MPVRFERLNPEKIPDRIPYLDLSVRKGLMTARFLEHPLPRQIPAEAQLVELRPSIKTPVETELLLPTMLPNTPGRGGFIMHFASGQPVECQEGMTLTILNLTPRRHVIKSPPGALLNGTGGILHLRGIGSSVTLLAFAGLWILTDTFDAELVVPGQKTKAAGLPASL